MDFEEFFENIVNGTIEYIEETSKPPAFTIFAMEEGLLVIVRPEDKTAAKEVLEQLRNDKVEYIILVGTAKMKIFKSKEEAMKRLGNLTFRAETDDGSVRKLIAKLEGDPDTIMAVFIIGRKRDGTTKVKNYEVTVTESGECSLIGEIKEVDFSAVGGNLVPEPW